MNKRKYDPEIAQMIIQDFCNRQDNLKKSTKIILNYIAATTIHSISEVYDAYSFNMAKYNTILSENEISQCMEFYGLYGIDDIVKLANVGK